MARNNETPVEAVYDGATFAALAPGPTKIVLTGMFHGDPSLAEAEKTEAEWQSAIDKFLATPVKG